MSNSWKEHIDVADLWIAYDNDDISLNELVDEFCSVLRTTKLYKSNAAFVDVVEKLAAESVQELGTFESDAFDSYLDEIYDIADVDRSLFINTHVQVSKNGSS